jgi:hypothetical protein
VRIHDGEHGVGSDGGVGRGAAALEHAQPGLRSGVVGCGDGTARGEDRLTPGPWQ